jgi:preprotein translocase subunit SecE
MGDFVARTPDVKMAKMARPVSRPTPAREGPSVVERVRRYLREVRAELVRVDWPSRQELIAMTIVVLVVLLAMALYLGAWDLVFSWLFQRVLVRS